MWTICCLRQVIRGSTSVFPHLINSFSREIKDEEYGGKIYKIACDPVCVCESLRTTASSFTMSRNDVVGVPNCKIASLPVLILFWIFLLCEYTIRCELLAMTLQHAADDNDWAVSKLFLMTLLFVHTTHSRELVPSLWASSSTLLLVWSSYRHNAGSTQIPSSCSKWYHVVVKTLVLHLWSTCHLESCGSTRCTTKILGRTQRSDQTNYHCLCQVCWTSVHCDEM